MLRYKKCKSSKSTLYFGFWSKFCLTPDTKRRYCFALDLLGNNFWFLIIPSSYITYLDENAPQGTALTFNDPYIPQVNDNDAGKNGVFSLSLVNNNGTFEISPTVAERHAPFIIKVRDNTILDFEARKSVVFQVKTITQYWYYNMFNVYSKLPPPIKHPVVSGLE